MSVQRKSHGWLHGRPATARRLAELTLAFLSCTRFRYFDEA